jgi:hypothetical protein
MDDQGYVFVRAQESGGARDEEDGAGGGGGRGRGQGGGGRGRGGGRGPAGEQSGFELLMQFPSLVDEMSAKSVYKDGVLFVIATPRDANIVAVRVTSGYEEDQ